MYSENDRHEIIERNKAVTGYQILSKAERDLSRYAELKAKPFYRLSDKEQKEFVRLIERRRMVGCI